jgi:predicted Fe-Mo cluster-binding NifX family protein
MQFKRSFKMKVAVSSTGKDLNAQIDPRFGRCAFFIIVDTDNMDFVSYDNENKALSGGAGIQAASFVVSKGAKAVLTGNCGPNAMTAFSAAGVTVYAGQTGTVGEAVERFKTGGPMPSAQPTVPGKRSDSADIGTGAYPAMGMGGGRGMGMGGGRGMGMGGGRGMGMGGGRGMGMGGGRGMGMGGGRGMGMGGGIATTVQASDGPAAPGGSREEMLASLKRQAEELKRQMEIIQAKIDNL